MNLQDWFKEAEWYDNHKLSTILNCKRKAFLHLTYRGGLEAGVGAGAGIGSCFHSALASYYSNHALPEEERRLKAYRSFSLSYGQRFKEEPEKPAHKEDRCIPILATYFETYRDQDLDQWKPIETELMFIVPIAPRSHEDFKPFFFTMRVDGIWELKRTGDWYIIEHKTIASGVNRELTRLTIARQPRGYVYGVRQFEKGHKVVGFMPNVLLIAAEKYEFGRDIRVISNLETDSWRAQTINIVQDWRILQIKSRNKPIHAVLDTFVQNDQHCTHYGLCPYFQVCLHGLPIADQIPSNKWTPIMGERENV